MNSGINLFKSEGILHYGSTKLIVKVDPGIAYFYRSLIPKSIYIDPQKYKPHISVVRNETPANMENWGKYENQKIEFSYGNQIYNGQVYWWINAFSTQLEEIRIELGLSISEYYTQPPDGFNKCFHITLGNCKKHQKNSI